MSVVVIYRQSIYKRNLCKQPSTPEETDKAINMTQIAPCLLSRIDRKITNLKDVTIKMFAVCFINFMKINSLFQNIGEYQNF